MKYAVVFLFLFSLSRGLWPDGYAEIAREYFLLGQHFYDSGELEMSLEYLDYSLDFLPSRSDSLFLKAQIFDKQGRYSLATEFVLQALEAENLESYSYDQNRFLYLSLLHRQKRYDEVISFSKDLFPPFSSFSDPDQTFLFLDSILRSESRQEYMYFFDEAVKQYPEDPRFRVLRDSSFNPPLLTTEEFLSLHGELQDSYIEAVRLFIYRLLPGETRKNWIQKYWQLGGPLDDKILEFYFDDLKNDEYRIDITYTDLFLPQQPRDLDVLQAIDRQLAGTSIGESVGRYLFSPPYEYLVRDLNNDGYHEEKYYIREGRISRWSQDENQDGVSEIDLTFENSVPKEVRISRENEEIRIVYRGYPFVGLFESRPAFGTSSPSPTTRFFLPLLELQIEVIDPRVPLGLMYPEEPYRVEIHENFSQDIDILKSIIPDNAYRIEWVEENLVMETGNLGEYRSSVLLDRNRSGYREIRVFDFHTTNLVLEFYDPNEDGWYEFVRTTDMNGVYFRDLYSSGEFLPFFGSDLPDRVSTLYIQLFHEYQNRLFHEESEGK